MRHGAELVRKLLKAGWPDGVVLNVNFPGLRARRGQGHVRHGAGPARSRTCSASRTALDTRGKAYYWIGIERRKAKPPQGHRSLGGALQV